MATDPLFLQKEAHVETVMASDVNRAGYAGSV